MYTAWSVVFGEQPTAAKWNQLGENDAGFKDGTNFDDSIIDSRHYADNSIDAEHLSLNAIEIGYSQSTSSQGSITTSETDLTNLSVAVTVPSGGRKVVIKSRVQAEATSDGTVGELKIKEGSTTLQTTRKRLFSSGAWESFPASEIVLSGVSAGAHTYKLTLLRAVGAGTISTVANAAYPNFIQVLVQ